MVKHIKYYINSGYKYIMFDKYGLIIVSSRLPDKLVRGKYIFFNSRVDYVDDTVIPKWTTYWEDSFITLDELVNHYKSQQKGTNYVND